jgi:LysM repeat protein/uncharacterized protein YvpB
MALALRSTVPAPASRTTPGPGAATAVGASYAFDPGADGLPGIYATRVLERGGDPRALCAEIRADLLGIPERGAISRALIERNRPSRFGRGTAAHLHATSQSGPQPAQRRPPRAAVRLTPPVWPAQPRWSRRLVTACIAALLLLPLGLMVASAQELPPQSRYVVREGDTLEGVAAEFGGDPAALLAASALQNPPYLTPAEVIVIPDPSETPEGAAMNAAERTGTSPFVAGAHEVAPGETLADIAAEYGVDPVALASLNGIAEPESLAAGALLRIPATDAAATSFAAWESFAPSPVIAASVPAYQQAYSLSCEYAAAFIATSAFGPGVPESAFMERIGQSANPHWGYRGDIAGVWGGTDDYGVYPEALAPTLNEFGFIADVFYGADPASLTTRLDDGMPVITWLGYFGDNAWQQADEGAYLLAPGMHVVTVYGYDSGGVYLANPGRGTFEHYTWDNFLAMWAVLDGMSLAVAPM